MTDDTHDQATHDHHACRSQASTPEGATRTTDRVCGMTVDPATTPHHAEHDGRAYHF